MNQQYAAALNKEECSIQHFLNLHLQFPTRRPQRGLPLSPSSLPGRRKEHLTKTFRNSHLRYALCYCILLICKNSIDLFIGFCYTMDSNRCALLERSIIPWISGPCWTATVLHTLPSQEKEYLLTVYLPRRGSDFSRSNLLYILGAFSSQLEKPLFDVSSKDASLYIQIPDRKYRGKDLAGAICPHRF